MSLSVKDQVAFWRTIAKDLERGRTLLAALEHATAKAAKTELEPVSQQLMRDIHEGQSFSEAMAAHESVFSLSVRTMARAGEAGGVLEVIAERIADGLQDESFPLLGAEVTEEDEQVRYWRAFGRLLSSGVPILEALDLIAEEVAGPKLAEATRVVRQSILDGENMAKAMEKHPDLFDNGIIQAVAQGEEQGILDEMAFLIADTLAAGDRLESVETLQGEEGEKGAVVKCVNLTVIEAIQQRASDIHLDPTEDGRGRIRLRVDGVLHDIEPPPAGLFPKIVSRIKIMSCLDIAERRLPQDGRIELNMSGKSYDLRVSSVPTVHGERIVMRILDRQSVRLDLASIGFPDDELATVRALCHLPNGILICNGPTGSGKTTLLYSMLSEIDRDKCCVMSVEDPVEYHIPGVAQTQVAPQRGLTYPRVLRSFLRQDPDVIMVGEMRDLETMNCCVQTALTGHLVLTTLHANTSPGALKRLIDVGLEPFLVNSAVAGVISQRLVRVLCPECKQEAEPQLHSLPPLAVEFIQQADGATFYAPKGCDACKGMGYRGRTAIHEILVPDERVRQAVAASSHLATIRNAALAAGMKPMLMDGLEKTARGITSLQEVCRVVPHGPND